MARTKPSEQWRRGSGADFFIGLDDAFLNFTMERPCRLADILGRIAEAMGLHLDPLPLEFDNWDMLRGLTAVGSAAKRLDALVASQENLCWRIKDGALQLAFIHPEVPNLTPHERFVEIAGRLRSEIVGRMTEEEEESIASKLDQHGFDVRQHLEGECREKLAYWNKRHPRNPITTWLAALQFRHQKFQGQDFNFRSCVLKTWNHAADKHKAHR